MSGPARYGDGPYTSGDEPPSRACTSPDSRLDTETSRSATSRVRSLSDCRMHAAFDGLGKPVEPEVSTEPLKPAVPIKKSITDDYIISLEDGRKLKLMKRYLSLLGMTPDQYRKKWGLPHDYPMVAPAYAAHRSALAKTIGLGRRSAQEADEQGPEVEAQPEPEAPKKAVRRGKKAAA